MIRLFKKKPILEIVEDLRKKDISYVKVIGGEADFLLLFNISNQTVYLMSYGKRYTKLYDIDKKFIKKIKTNNIDKNFIDIFGTHTDNLPMEFQEEYKVCFY